MEHNTIEIKSEILSEKEMRRYAMQISLPEMGVEGQERIKQARVLVIGAGGKGTSVLENLVTIGVGKLGISDNYPVQESELSRQHLYGNSDLGKQKAIIAREKLKEINHLVKFQLHNVCLTKANIISIAEQYDILVDATDNFPTHYLLNEASEKLNKPLVFGSVFGGLGYVSVFNYQGGPSLLDAYPENSADEAQADQQKFSCQVALMSIIGAIMANETVKVILSRETPLSNQLLSINSADYSFSFTPVK